MAKVLKGIAEGFEINIYHHEFDRSELTSEDDFYKLFLDFVVEANLNSEAYPVDPVLKDDQGNKIRYKKKCVGDFQKFPDRNRIRLTTYYIYRDAYYDFEYILDTDITLEYCKFDGNRILKNIKQGSNVIELEPDGTYDSIHELTGYEYRNNSGHKLKLSTDIFYTFFERDEISEEHLLELRELTDEWYEEIINHD